MGPECNAAVSDMAIHASRTFPINSVRTLIFGGPSWASLRTAKSEINQKRTMQASVNDRETSRKMIISFYNFAGVEIANWDGTINDEVVEVFISMYKAAVKCSDAFVLIPVPPKGMPSLLWLFGELGQITVRSYEKKLSVGCARASIARYGHLLSVATQGMFSSKELTWA